MTYYERNLPHWQPEGRAIFLTWRLYGSLPTSVLRQLSALANKPGKQFLVADGILDQARSEPLWLREPAIAGSVEDALRKGARELKLFSLHAFVIMANHVHILLEPAAPLARITKGIKAAAARDANRILRRTGRPFWQGESFDHWVRGPAEFERIRAYIQQNPVKAGLVSKPQDWPWSSAHK
jgi:REP element-mobilizing transposase RayT